MASRRAFVSSALRASAAVRPARPIFSVAVRTARTSLAPRAFAPFARSTRDYSVKTSEPKQWEFEELKNLVQKGANEEIVIVDVREPHELFETGKIPGAINIPITTAVQSFHIPEEDFEEMYGFERPSKDKELLFYCKAGIRAKSASQLANHAGWKKTSEYPGSWLDWEEHNGPVEKVKKY
ncbi:hypothetical protein NW752_005635 [Fusarium irregulare]|uniref:Rhodanese domain-containing protein n=1 Tax=Fusarium irregulare TaxID=2494466 RepID=A0A9W8PPY5_9HYPO|nr:hypothetical protein LB507_011117 [Fusarium sp. FIESC RH6]KAJ4013923.1 hypothetical protein NW766_006164 [Fusarium irregulare]KAJ4018518.1 hypothetical protein NW752_005635 [Fusarium irregulare]